MKIPPMTSSVFFAYTSLLYSQCCSLLRKISLTLYPEDYQEYFSYLREVLECWESEKWQEALSLFTEL